MNRRQLAAVSALPLLTGSMVWVYRLLEHRLGRRRSWYAGFPIYWLLWCGLLPLQLLGADGIRSLFRGKRPNGLGWLVMLMPPAVALLGRFGQKGGEPTGKERVVLAITAVMNGTMEELLWRGVYVKLFAGRPFWAIVWPSIWFGLWHYAPGSVSPLTGVGTLMGGAGVLGISMGWLTVQTRSVIWAMISHTAAGLAQV